MSGRAAAGLLSWYGRAKRDLPWRRSSDPYRIWIAEVMLQQTRVAAAIPYYERFLERFPDAQALARATEAEVLACWSGLGYYSRARNLRRAAQVVVEAGGFPRDYEAIRKLPGIGDYTAAAIASMAFGLPRAAVDGNVVRVLARWTEERGDVGSAKTRRRIEEAAASLLDRKRPGEFNQALMELGATVCLPRDPRCGECPLARSCQARGKGLERELPVKRRRPGPERIAKTLLLIRKGKRILLGRSKMAGFWELPEASRLPEAVVGATVATLRHTITCHQYRLSVARAELGRIPRGYKWVAAGDPESIPLATATRKALARIP
ncbi:MAG: A/G-specific adenine glycosylase [Bryobacteraceae bacterium]